MEKIFLIKQLILALSAMVALLTGQKLGGQTWTEVPSTIYDYQDIHCFRGQTEITKAQYDNLPALNPGEVAHCVPNKKENTLKDNQYLKVGSTTVKAKYPNQNEAIITDISNL